MKIKALLYCTKTKPYITRGNDDSVYPSCVISDGIKEWHLNGKIVAECDFDVEEIMIGKSITVGFGETIFISTPTLQLIDLSTKSCLNGGQIYSYLKGKNGYAIHIRNLKERVMELSNVYKYDNSYDNMFGWAFEDREKYKPLTKAPQNMMKVWLYENGEWVMYILISIQPQWMCLILNRIKDVEVRKVVLKEMIN